MNRALLELIARSLRGRVIRTLRLAKRPRYWIGLIAGVGWIVFQLSNVSRRHWAPHGNDAPEILGANPETLRGMLIVGALGVALFTTLSWLVGRGRSRIRLNEAEVHTLFTAPLTQREVINYALLKSQIPVLMTSLVLPILFSPGTIVARLQHWPGFWIAVTIADLQGKAAYLWKLETEYAAPDRARRRRWTLRCFLLLFWGAVIWRLAILLPQVIEAFRAFDRASGPQRFAALLERFGAVGADPLLSFLTAPLRWALQPLLVTSPSELWWVALPALGLLALHYEWVVRTRAPFGEAALQGAAEAVLAAAPQSQQLRRMGDRRRRAQPFKLAPTGFPEAALLYRAMALRARSGVIRNLAIGAALALLLALVVALFGAPLPLVVMMIVSGAGIALFSGIGAGASRNVSLRGDFPTHVDVVRAWPIDPARYVLTQVATSALSAFYVSLFGFALLISGDLAFRIAPLVALVPVQAAEQDLAASWGVPPFLFVWLIAAGALLPIAALQLVSSAAQTLALLWFPGFFAQPEEEKGSGIAASGQRMLWGIGMMMVLLLSQLPGALLLLLVTLAQRWTDLAVTAWEFPLFGLIAAAPTAVIAGLLVTLGGKAWRRLDVTES